MWVNYTKSQALNVSLQPSLVAQLKESFQFAPKFEQLYSANYLPIYQKLETDLKAWSQYELSWLGKINSIKMTLLPRLLYLFRSLPILIRKDHLCSFQSKIIKFVWGKSGHRLSRHTLFRLRTRGGLGLPNLLWYYQATRLSQLSTVYSKLVKPVWVDMERQVVPSHTLEFLLWCPSANSPSHSFPPPVPRLSHVG